MHLEGEHVFCRLSDKHISENLSEKYSVLVDFYM